MATLSYFNRFMAKMKHYATRSWGYPFIFAFLIILGMSAVSLAVGWASGAEIMADIAYFSLVVGVILELAYSSGKVRAFCSRVKGQSIRQRIADKFRKRITK